MQDIRQNKHHTNDLKLDSAPRPAHRMRRMRKTSALRSLVRENHLTTDDLVFPVFVEENATERKPVASLPGMYRETENSLQDITKEAAAQGIKAMMVFGVSHNKDNVGSDSMNRDGLLARMTSQAKDASPETAIIADVCFCEYTDHGHCGPLTNDGDVDNDRTLDNLARQAVIAAEAGADIIAPSGMMDGMVAAIRDGLDQSGFTDTPILSYASKFASAFYGPFRDAAGCSLGHYEHAKKDRKTYQMDPANGNEALREAIIDMEEGADMLMVKPGLPYLDILYRIKSELQMPTFAYNVSGEFAMLKAAAEKGLLNYDDAMMEMLLSFKRAGADGILTYAAMDAAKIINEG